MMNKRIAECLRLAEIKQGQDRVRISILMNDSLTDEDGYPTDAALEIIKLWDFQDSKGWFAFIKSIWAYNSWGWHEGMEASTRDKDKEIYTYNISTAGWSGNESIVGVMQENPILWSTTWVQSRRGGHFIFEDIDYGE